MGSANYDIAELTKVTSTRLEMEVDMGRHHLPSQKFLF
jgi:hypothetical protein